MNNNRKPAVCAKTAISDQRVGHRWVMKLVRHACKFTRDVLANKWIPCCRIVTTKVVDSILTRTVNVYATAVCECTVCNLCMAL